jgi:hypothetical protein
MRNRMLRSVLVAAFSAVMAVGILVGLSESSGDVQADSAWPARVTSEMQPADSAWPAPQPIVPSFDGAGS